MYKLIFFILLSTFCAAYGRYFWRAANLCPGADLIKPCTCNETDVLVECTGLKSHDVIRTIFSNVPEWKLDTLDITESTMIYIPACIFENSSITTMTVKDTTLVSLFDVLPKSESLKKIEIENVILQQGMRWDLFLNLSLDYASFTDTRIPLLGKQFKENIPENIKSLLFEGNGITRILDQPFEDLENLTVLSLKNQLLQELELLKFPQSITDIDLNNNKLKTLPDGFFKLPNLKNVYLNGNLFSTMKEEIFSGIPSVFIADNPLDCACVMKWVVVKKMTEHISSGNCATPANEKGKELAKLADSDFSYCE